MAFHVQVLGGSTSDLSSYLQHEKAAEDRPCTHMGGKEKAPSSGRGHLGSETAHGDVRISYSIFQIKINLFLEVWS